MLLLATEPLKKCSFFPVHGGHEVINIFREGVTSVFPIFCALIRRRFARLPLADQLSDKHADKRRSGAAGDKNVFLDHPSLCRVGDGWGGGVKDYNGGTRETRRVHLQKIHTEALLFVQGSHQDPEPNTLNHWTRRLGAGPNNHGAPAS